MRSLSVVSERKKTLVEARGGNVIRDEGWHQIAYLGVSPSWERVSVMMVTRPLTVDCAQLSLLCDILSVGGKNASHPCRTSSLFVWDYEGCATRKDREK